MKQFVSIYFVVIFAAVLATQGDAKRGCSLYGHSCYGGHGKRSEIVEVFPRDKIPPYKQLSEEIRPEGYIPSPSEGNRNYDLYPKYRLLKLIKQWIEGGRPSEKFPESDVSNEIYKESPAN